MMEFQTDNEDKPLTKTEKSIALIVSVILGILFLLLIFVDYQPAKLSFIFFIVFWAILLFIHELGHAIMAYFCGWKVEKIVFGFGRLLKSFNYRGVQIEIRLYLIEGFTRIKPLNFKHLRTKDAVIYFAGPGIELLIGFALLIIMGFSLTFNPDGDYFDIFYKTFIISCFLGAVVNLIPQSVFTKDGEIPNDGLGILYALGSTQEDYEKAYLDTMDKKNE